MYFDLHYSVTWSDTQSREKQETDRSWLCSNPPRHLTPFRSMLARTSNKADYNSPVIYLINTTPPWWPHNAKEPKDDVKCRWSSLHGKNSRAVPAIIAPEERGEVITIRTHVNTVYLNNHMRLCNTTHTIIQRNCIFSKVHLTFGWLWGIN